jgi:hypothetical protein
MPSASRQVCGHNSPSPHCRLDSQCLEKVDSGCQVVAVMQSAKPRHGYNSAGCMGRHRCYTTCRSSLLPMRDESDPRDSSGYTRSTTASDAARSERSHESSKSLLQLPTQRSATPFCHGLRKPEPDAEALDNTDDFCIEVRGAVKDQVARVRLVWKGLADLLHNPGAGRMLCGTSMRNSPPIMRDHEEAVEHPEGQCRHTGSRLLGAFRIQRETVRSEISKPSILSFP